MGVRPLVVVLMIGILGCRTVVPTSTPLPTPPPTSTPLPTSTSVPDWRNDLPQTMEACDQAVDYLESASKQAYQDRVEHEYNDGHIYDSNLTSVESDRALSQWLSEADSLERIWKQVHNLHMDVLVHCRELEGMSDSIR